MVDPIPDNPEATPASLVAILAGLAAVEAKLETFLTKIHGKGLETQETSRIRAEDVAERVHDRELDADTLRWQANDEAHVRIEERLNNLNGFRNRIIGIMALLGVAGPVAIGVWQIMIRG